MEALLSDLLSLTFLNVIVMISIRAICTGCIWISPNHFKQKFNDNGEFTFLEK